MTLIINDVHLFHPGDRIYLVSPCTGKGKIVSYIQDDPFGNEVYTVSLDDGAMGGCASCYIRREDS